MVFICIFLSVLIMQLVEGRRGGGSSGARTTAIYPRGTTTAHRSSGSSIYHPSFKLVSFGVSLILFVISW
ncbi:hypothetical protein BVRB_6g147840 [Beta vulgaris subsp. vulgaris]|nr:hypothetical protein BVRB_6g147840 [Beta vulgaris subsp. vulgaris]